ncbi:MAG: DUF975 family protein [Acutalibacteraceae bacterium]
MYDRKRVKFEAKQSLNANFGIALGTIIVAGLIMSAAAAFTFSIATIVLSGVIEVGLAIVMLNIVRGYEVDFAQMFKGFENFGTTCLAGVLTGLYTLLWTMLFVIPGIVKAYSYSMTFYILADNPDMKPNEAIKASCQMMKGHKFDLFVLQLSFFWWNLLGLVTFGIAYIYVIPYMSAAEAKFYDTIKNEYFTNTNSAEYSQQI